MKRVLRDRVFRTAIVTLKAGSSFRGVLYSHDREAMVLRNVEHLAEGADKPTPVDGELVVLLTEVLYLQFT
jgi:hypothetical protein